MARTEIKKRIYKKAAVLNNILLAQKIITDLVSQRGVKTFCFCAGSRNSPFFYVLSHSKNLNVFSFFEERSAGFFALGRVRAEARPAAVVTTSGTAAAELLPAAIEAYYSNLPLVLLTADRPAVLRGTGFSQTIQQVGVFSHYAVKTYDIKTRFPKKGLPLPSCKPCHINVCFKEPLLDSIDPPPAPIPCAPKNIVLKTLTPRAGETAAVKKFFLKNKKPLFILSEMPAPVRPLAGLVLSRLKQPVYAEALSNLRESKNLLPFILKSGGGLLNKLVLNKQIDSVVRIGRRPVARFWRDLETRYVDLPVLSVSDQPYAGLSRRPPAVSFESFFSACKNWGRSFFDPRAEVFKQDQKDTKLLQAVWQKYPLSEWALVRSLSQKISYGSFVFLGNSLPIRAWDLAAVYDHKNLKHSANKGASGIDGLVSSFLGESSFKQDNWCLLGDLSCLYDLTAPWVLKQIFKHKCFIVVVNNGGGKIFSFLPGLADLFKTPPALNKRGLKNPLNPADFLLSRHQLSFKPWADLWGMNYYKIERWSKNQGFASPAVIELKPQPRQTQAAARRLKAL